MPRRTGLILLLAVGPLAAADAPSATQPRVGVASVLELKAQAAQNGVVRTLVLRDALFRNERLTTGAEPGSLLHVRLLDDTVITLGPSSEVLLDDFAVDPGAGTAEVNLKLSRGLLRFVGGQHAKVGTRYQVKTPVATIGVRGTSFDVKVGDSGETTVLLEEGELSFENEDGLEVILDDPNEVSSIEDADDLPSEPEIDVALSEEFDSLDLSDEQVSQDSEIAEELDDAELEPIVGEDPDEDTGDGETADAADGDTEASASDRGDPAARSPAEGEAAEPADPAAPAEAESEADTAPEDSGTGDQDEKEEAAEEDEDDSFADDEDW